MEEDKAVSTQNRSRFEARKSFNISHSNSPHEHDATIETLILRTAMNSPFHRVSYPRISTYTPCFATTMYYLNYMDTLMASTKNWTDNCMGWVPPYSQIYISILLYIQTFSAMEHAGPIPSEILTLLKGFQDKYPLRSLYIPGPLVQAFKNLSSFSPRDDDQFGNVSPSVPSRPGWSRERGYRLGNNLSTHLPHVHLFGSRLRVICAVATSTRDNVTTFRAEVDGRCNVATLFNQPCNNGEHEIANLSSPGASFAYAGNLGLWPNAAARIETLGVPFSLDVKKDEVHDSWASFLGFGESIAWFGPLSDMMARYCRFWRGSASLDECSPNCSPAGAVICTETGGNMFDAPRWIRNENEVGHYTMRSIASLKLSAATTIEDIPEAHLFAGSTFNFNLIPAQGAREDYLNGPFWSIVPDAYVNTGIQITQSILSTISREYHCDSRI